VIWLFSAPELSEGGIGAPSAGGWILCMEEAPWVGHKLGLLSEL
jgi:hypothetical protein